MAPWASGTDYGQGEKVLGLAYNESETRDKRLVSPPLSYETFLIAAHGSMDWAAAHSYAVADVYGAMDRDQKKT